MKRPGMLGIGGLILVTLGAGVGLGGLIYRSRNEVVGADIGAGLLMLLGIALAFVGIVILVLAGIDRSNQNRRSHQ